MTILDDSALEFAKEHLNRFADSDFFPPLFEYEAVWKGWDEFKDAARNSDVAKLIFPTPFQLPAPKPSQTFRIVHQLDPLSCIVYTSLARSVCDDIEHHRIDKNLKISCSYRMIPDSGSFFSDGTGYADFLDQTKTLCDVNAHVLSTDISDFYNQIYSHRVENSISSLGSKLTNTARDIERVIHSLNSQSSKGIPTGPNAIIIFSEAILLDVDDLLYRQGVKFCRFVDDFRIFSDSRQELMQVAQLLSEYLYDQHRLHLSSNKTSLLATEKFLEREFFNHYRIEVEEAFVVLGEIEYGGVASVVEFEDGADTGIPFGVLVAKKELSDTEALKEIAARLKETATKTNRVDLNLLRAFLRRCRLANSDAFRPLLESNIEIFLPVFHDLTKALRQLYSVGHQHFVVDFIRKIYESDLISLKFIRYWSDWLASQDADLLAKSGASGAIRANGNLRHQANAAVVSNDLAWVRGFRANVDQLGDWDRRAIVGAARILGKVERRVFLNSVRKRFSGQIVDKLLVDYVSAL